MTNEEAIKIIDKSLDIGNQMPFLTVDQAAEAKHMAIKALLQQTEYHGTEDMDGLYYCPICQQTTTVIKDGKCPKCGATMDKLSTRAQQTEDAISRQAAIDAVAFGITYATGVNMETGEVSYPFAESNHELRKAIHRICELPLVTPKQRTGHWVLLRNDNGARSYQCSLCGHWHPLHDHSLGFRYCNWCGAKMVEPQESEGNNG